MQRQTVADYILTQIADLSPDVKDIGELNLRNTIQSIHVPSSTLMERIRYQYGVRMDDGLNPDIEMLTLEDFIGFVKGRLNRNAAEQVECKSVMEGFVFTGRTKRLTSPYEINIDLTFRCNLKCIFCYASAAEPREEKVELSTDEVFDIIDEFHQLNGAFVLFGGGEPFIREDFLEIFRYTKSKGLWTYIISNGSMLTEEVVYEYSKYCQPSFDKIQISLDGSTAEINDKQRGVKGAFEATTQGIRNLTARGIRPLINTVVTRINFDDIPNLLNLAVDLNAATYRCLKLHKIGRGKRGRMFETLGLTQTQFEKLFDFLTRKRDELMGVIGIASDNACVFPMSTPAIRAQFELKPGEEPASYSCAAGTTKVAVAPDGGVVPCSYFYDFPEFYIGSLKRNSLKEIWEDERGWRDFREPLQVEGKCVQCGYLYACKTGCRLMAYVGCGSMGGPDIGCTYNPVEDQERKDTE